MVMNLWPSFFLVHPVYHSESQRVTCITTAAHASADIEQNAAIVSRAPTNAAKRSTVQILSFFRQCPALS